jgi:hypothetical protein
LTLGLEDGNGGLVGRVQPDGWTTLSFLDGAGGERLMAGLAYDGEPRVQMTTPGGRPRVTLGSDMSGRADLVLHDADGAERAVVRLAPGGEARLEIYDARGKNLFSAP